MAEQPKRCEHPRPLVWHRASERPVPITNQPLEMMAASGFMALAKWNGFCPDCGAAVEWSSDKPKEARRAV